MTREEAIRIIREIQYPVNADNKAERDSAISMAIKALEQEPSGDLISRQAVLNMLEDINAETEGVGFYYEHYVDYVKSLSSVKPQSCEDAISRKALKHKLQEHHDFFVNAYGGFSNLPQNDKSRVDEISNCIAMVVNEPSVKPSYTDAEIDKMQELEQAQIQKAYELGQEDRPTGHWKRISMDKYSEHAKYWYRCDRCGKDNLGNTDFCPNCGAKMIET